ncbi:hypothetical protein C2E23DRAFT_287708 [Lenzites betulinus]|nr:hypothetical protein C2E23DRAFT_287708 [Lenzites betulinus]
MTASAQRRVCAWLVRPRLCQSPLLHSLRRCCCPPYRGRATPTTSSLSRATTTVRANAPARPVCGSARSVPPSSQSLRTHRTNTLAASPRPSVACHSPGHECTPASPLLPGHRHAAVFAARQRLIRPFISSCFTARDTANVRPLGSRGYLVPVDVLLVLR